MLLNVPQRLASIDRPGVLAPRLLTVLAHPDDEVLALGGRLEHLTTTTFLCVTDGVPLDGADARAHGFAHLADYGVARRAELASALRLAGLDPASARTLSVAGRPISDQTAATHLAALTRALALELPIVAPEAILTHPYEGGHPDHDACAFAVHTAVRLNRPDLPILEAPFYHAGPHGIETGIFLPGDGNADPGVDARLTREQAAHKRDRLACFQSQAETLGLFDLSAERFRLAPAYDFTQRPHPGQIFYEQFPWGMDGDRFCALAAAALQELGL